MRLISKRLIILVLIGLHGGSFAHRPGSDNVLLFFYLSDCSFCHQQAADIRQAFSMQNMDLAVHGIALDAQPLNGFDFPWSVDYGISEQFAVTIVPTLVLYHRPTEQHRIISQGYQPLLQTFQTLGWMP